MTNYLYWQDAHACIPFTCHLHLVQVTLPVKHLTIPTTTCTFPFQLWSNHYKNKAELVKTDHTLA